MAILDLFRPKWKHSNWAVRIKAVEKIKDQELLINIAKSDENIQVRKAAIKKVSDQRVVSELELLLKKKIESDPIQKFLKDLKSKPDAPKLMDFEDTSFKSQGSSSSSPIQPRRPY